MEVNGYLHIAEDFLPGEIVTYIYWIIGRSIPITCLFSRVEAGWNSSTVALRVVRGDGKGTQCPGV
jgi:hypothetical protein